MDRSRIYLAALTDFLIENFLINKEDETPQPKKVGVANANSTTAAATLSSSLSPPKRVLTKKRQLLFCWPD